MHPFVDPERTEILQWLSKVEYKGAHLDAKAGRIDGTGGWLSRKKEFREWRKSERSGVLWLHGIREIPYGYLQSVMSVLTSFVCVC